MKRFEKINQDLYVFLMWLAAMASLTFVLVLIRDISVK